MAVFECGPALSTFSSKARVLPYRVGANCIQMYPIRIQHASTFFGNWGKTSPRSGMVLGRGSVGPRADDNEYERAGIGPSGRNLASTRGLPG
jgi:hypothetical protein